MGPQTPRASAYRRDRIFGGAGDDTVTYDSAPGPIFLDLFIGHAVGAAGEGEDRIVSIEIVIG